MTKYEQVGQQAQLCQTCGPLIHLLTVIAQPFCLLKFLCVSMTAKANTYEIITCSRDFVLQSDWYHHIQEVNIFLMNITTLSPLPVFERREPIHGQYTQYKLHTIQRVRAHHVCLILAGFCALNTQCPNTF